MPDPRRVGGWLTLALAVATPALWAQGLPAEDVAMLLSAAEGGSLALESAAVVWSVEGDEAELRVSLELPVEGLASPDAERVGLRWAVYVVDDAGAVIASRFQSVTAERRRLEESGRAGVRILESLKVPVVPVSVRTLVRESGSSRFGLRVLAVDPTAGPRPFVARRRDGWIELGPAASRVQPAALAAVRAGQALDLMVPAGADVDGAGWVLRRQGAEDELEDVPLAAAPAAQASSDPGGWRRWRATAPEGVEGRHRLVRSTDPDAGAPAVHVVSAAAGGPVAWPQAVDVSVEPAHPDLVPAGQGRVRDDEMRRRLREALSASAEEGSKPGTEALLGVVDEAWSAAGSDGVATVVDEALDLGADLVRTDPASLPALLAAVDRLYELCADRMHHPCTGGMRLLLPALLRATEDAAPEEAPSMAAAWMLLGWRSIERQAFGQAVDHLRYAARLEPERPEPRVALAKVFEIAEDYRQAARVLEELLESHPALPEARLRLGVQYRRLGRHRAAVRTLRAAAAEGSAWTRIVASQELAALHRERGEVERAEETLRLAIERFPEDEQLALQLAALLDASGRIDAATALLAGLGEPGSATRTPRNRYSRWPPVDLQSARTRLHRTGTERHEALAVALQDFVR